MKILIYSDVHFSEYSSIVRGQGKEFSNRLENLLKSINWAETLAANEHCDEVICLGDFFDKPDLNSRELTALSTINWAKIPHSFIVGNHEASSKSLQYNSVTALANNGFNIISKPTCKEIITQNKSINLIFLPYCLDEDRRSLSEYYSDLAISINNPKIIFSHNDIKGLQYGLFTSKDGFDIADIVNNCNLFLNGHLHNCGQFCEHGLNIGNLTGLNFSEDAFKYNHSVLILDLDTGILESIENPHALNFYKISIESESDIDQLHKIKNNAVLSIRCIDAFKEQVNKIVENLRDKIIDYKLIKIFPLNPSNKIVEKKQITSTTIDHIEKFKNFMLDKLGNDETVISEIMEICK